MYLAASAPLRYSFFPSLFHPLQCSFLDLQVVSEAMAERSAKVRRILGASGIPHARLSRLLQALAKEGVIADEDNTSRQQLQRTWLPLVQTTGVVEELPLEDGGAFQWECVSFGQALKHMAQESDTFRQLLAECWALHPCSETQKWSLLLYGDEVVPGNALRPDNHRKMTCFYMAILEQKLQSGCAGACRLFKVILRRLFLQEALGTDGITLDLKVAGGSYARLLFSLGNVIADADAHRVFWSWKGA